MKLFDTDIKRTRAYRQATIGAAAVALVFSLFVIAEMFFIWQRVEESRPIDHPRLLALRDDLGREQGSTAIMEEIRREERTLRAHFLTGERQLTQGAWMLLAGLVVFALSTKLAMATRPRVPVILARSVSYDPDLSISRPGRWSVIVVASCLMTTAITIPIVRQAGPATESARGVWPRFRGAGGLGISAHADVPLDFDAREGRERNIRWKQIVPLPGMSSPTVWNNRVFLTGALESAREVYCFDALTGALLWRRAVSAGPTSSQVPENVFHETGYAAPTAVTDGAHVWAMFANGDVVCLDVFGKQVWCINLGLPENMYGVAASPVLFADKLVLQIDQEPGDAGNRSALIALNAATGSEVWRTPRDVASSWPTPIPIRVSNNPQIVTCANPFVIAYDPSDGSEVWRVDCLAGDGGPSPTFAEGLVLAVNVGMPLTAIRPNGKGDVTETHVPWEYDDGLPDVCSLLAAHGRVWMQASHGVTTCLDAKTGKMLWTKDHGKNFYASPALAGDRVYLISRKGELIVLDAGREYRELATGHLGERCDTSMAFAEGRIYIRGQQHLFCIMEPDS
ncbi:MAG: outer membrane protein assembly factor BamB family protein [Planctomycetota bacterium]|jgi:outer membrane protein assembly factor BamB